MEVDRLNIKISRHEPVEDYSTFQYIICANFGKLKWEVARRFSDFANLDATLRADNYAMLPVLPSKTLFGRPQDSQSVETRKRELEIYLRELLVRPDTRTSSSLLDFLQFCEKSCANVPSLKPQLISANGQSRFAAACFFYDNIEKALFVAYEDISSTSKLGRVWSIVEPEDIGSLAVWIHIDEPLSKFTLMHQENTHFKVRRIHYDRPSRRIFAGFGDGRIAMYTMASGSFVLQLVKILKVHGASVVHFSASPSNILSVGFDGTVRLISVNKFEVITGGRLTQRLSGGTITTCYLDDEMKRAFIGSSCGEVLIYDTKKDPPEFIHCLKIKYDDSITHICCVSGNLFVGHCNTVSCYLYDHRTQPKNITKTAQFVCPFYSWKTKKVNCIACDPMNKVLFVGFDSSIVAWSLLNGKCIYAFKGHCGGTLQITIISGQNIILSSGEDGMVKVWQLPPAEELKFWSPYEYCIEASRGSIDDSQGMFNADAPGRASGGYCVQPNSCGSNSLGRSKHGLHSLSEESVAPGNGISSVSSTSFKQMLGGFIGTRQTTQEQGIISMPVVSILMEAESDNDYQSCNYESTVIEPPNSFSNKHCNTLSSTSTSNNFKSHCSVPSFNVSGFLRPICPPNDLEDMDDSDNLRIAFNPVGI